MWDKTQRAYHVTNIRNQPKENTVYTVAPKINYINLRRKHYKSQREQKHIPSGLVQQVYYSQIHFGINSVLSFFAVSANKPFK